VGNHTYGGTLTKKERVTGKVDGKAIPPLGSKNDTKKGEVSGQGGTGEVGMRVGSWETICLRTAE